MSTSQQDVPIPNVQPDPRTREERELDERYSAQLAQQRVLNNLRQKVKSLGEIAGKSVVKIIENCVRNNADFNPLEGLPGVVLTIVKNAMGYSNSKNLRFVKYLITESTQEVTLDFGRDNPTFTDDGTPCTPEQVSSLLGLLNKCQNQLIKLNISINHCMIPPSLIQINDIVSHQSNLRELVLKNCDITDETMAHIGSTCQNLRVLNINHNIRVTDSGLPHLCVSSEPHRNDGKCTKITSLSIENTSITDAGLPIALFNMPNLETVNFTPINITEVLVKLCENNSPLVLSKFKSLTVPIITNIKNCRELFPKLLIMLPNLLELNISTAYIDIDQLLMLKNIKKLCIIINKKNTDCSALPNVILQLKDTLSVIRIWNITQSVIINIDMSILAQCPCLEKIVYTACNISPKTEYPLLPSSFSRLVSVSIDTGHRLHHMPEHIAIKMLQSKYLESFDTPIKISENELKTVVDEVSVLNPDVFSKLSNIHLLNRYSLETWIKFLCVLPDQDMGVTIVTYETMLSDTHREILNSFARRNNIFAFIDI